MIFGITGAKKSGKSTVAEYLYDNLTDAVRIPFAGPLKTMLKTLGLSDAQLYGDDKEKEDHEILCGKTSRWAMQSLGTEWGREHIGKDIWMNAWLRQVNKYRGGRAVILTDDVRFPNEVQVIKDLGGKIIKVRRPKVEVQSQHESEMHILSLPCDFEVFQSEGDPLVACQAAKLFADIILQG